MGVLGSLGAWTMVKILGAHIMRVFQGSMMSSKVQIFEVHIVERLLRYKFQWAEYTVV